MTGLHLFNAYTTDDGYFYFQVDARSYRTKANYDPIQEFVWPADSKAKKMSAQHARNFKGDIAEILIFDHTFNPKERNRVNAYLADKWI